MRWPIIVCSNLSAICRLTSIFVGNPSNTALLTFNDVRSFWIDARHVYWCVLCLLCFSDLVTRRRRACDGWTRLTSRLTSSSTSSSCSSSSSAWVPIECVLVSSLTASSLWWREFMLPSTDLVKFQLKYSTPSSSLLPHSVPLLNLWFTKIAVL